METTTRSDRLFFRFNALLSLVAVSFLAWLLLGRSVSAESTLHLRFMPAVNACLNATAAVLLILGRLAIARRQVETHRYLMVSAFVASALFLVGYVAYHAVHGDTKFGGAGLVRGVYLALLASHVLLSISVVPLSLSAFYFAFTKRFATHVKVTRILHPIWLYVSVTGVIIFLMLRPYYRAE
jgi:putative membrane protein